MKCRIIMRKGCLREVEIDLPSQKVIITDPHVAKLYGHNLAKKLNAELLIVPQGEQYKTRKEKERLEDLLFEKKYNRDTLLIGIGGGMITDITGYLASTFMRGIPCIFIPTTLLAMVDASIGGKNGVNTPFGKNTVGTIYPPTAIFIDIETLNSLPEQELICGLSEIIKYALIASPSLWQLLATTPHPWKHPACLIQPSITIKENIVAQDSHEKGIRTILNFGHTFAHALETISSYQMSHGEAVAAGLLFESYLSFILGHLPKKTFDQIEALMHSIPFSFRLPIQASFPFVLETMKKDKKNTRDMPRFVLLKEIGEPLILDEHYAIEVDEKPLREAYDWYEKKHGAFLYSSQ